MSRLDIQSSTSLLATLLLILLLGFYPNVTQAQGGQLWIPPNAADCTLQQNFFEGLLSNKWIYTCREDKITDERVSYARNQDIFKTIRLSVVCTENKRLQLSVETREPIGPPNSMFELIYRVDRKKPRSFAMLVSSNRTIGFTYGEVAQLARDIDDGENLHLRLKNAGGGNADATLSLENAATAIPNVLADCGVQSTNINSPKVNSDYTFEHFKRDFDQLKPEKKRQVLDKVRTLMGQ